MTPKMEMDEYGTKRWTNEKGFYHRLDGPACEYLNGNKFWYMNGQFHHINGPAVELYNRTKHWYVNGNLITGEVNEWLADNNYTYPFNDEAQVQFKLRFS